MNTTGRWLAPFRRALRSRRVLLWAALLGAALFIALRADWVEIGRYLGPVQKDPPATTLWDWLDLLVIPVSLGFAAMFFNHQARLHDLRTAAAQRASDLEIADNRNQEYLLSNYFDKMTDLILERRLPEIYHLPAEMRARLYLRTVAGGEPEQHSLPEEVEAMRHVLRLAQSRTVTVLRQLDKTRQNIVFQFLRDADLDNFLLSNVSLEWVDLRSANLYGANLSGAYLRRTDLSGAILSRSRLSGAILSEADLRNADMSAAVLDGADLQNARLDGIDLYAADLRGARLQGASLQGANLRRADLRGADLSRANLSEADLFGAQVDPGGLSTVHALHGAIMPDGWPFDPNRAVSPAEPPAAPAPAPQTE